MPAEITYISCASPMGSQVCLYLLLMLNSLILSSSWLISPVCEEPTQKPHSYADETRHSKEGLDKYFMLAAMWFLSKHSFIKVRKEWVSEWFYNQFLELFWRTVCYWHKSMIISESHIQHAEIFEAESLDAVSNLRDRKRASHNTRATTKD